MALNISSDLVPQVINDYNAYTEDDLLIGLADEITLPKIKNKTTLSLIHILNNADHLKRSRAAAA